MSWESGQAASRLLLPSERSAGMDTAAHELSGELTPAGLFLKPAHSHLQYRFLPCINTLPLLILCRLGTRRPLGGCGSEEEPPTHHCEYVHVFQLRNHYWDRHR